MRPRFNQGNGRKPSAGDRDMKHIHATDRALAQVDARLALTADNFAEWLRFINFAGESATTKTCIMTRLSRRLSREDLDACREALCL